MIYRNDSTRKLSGVGDTSHKALRDAYGIKTIDHRKAENLFESKFGADYFTELDKQALKNEVCVTEFINHIFETKKKSSIRVPVITIRGGCIMMHWR